MSRSYSLGMTEQLLTEAIRAGELAEQPVRPLAHVLIGALDEAAMVIATADDPTAPAGRPGRCCSGWSTGCSTHADRRASRMPCRTRGFVYAPRT